MKTFMEIVKLAEENDIEIELFQKPIHQKLSVYWYSDTVATLTDLKTSIDYDVVANGEIRSFFYTENLDDPSETVVDKYNDGAFLREMSYFIKNDAELFKYTENFEEGKLPALEFADSNWFEILPTFEDDVALSDEIAEVLEADSFYDALECAILYMVDLR